MVEGDKPQWTREQLHGAATVLNPQTGTNQFDSQRGMTAVGAVRMNIYITKDQGRIEHDRKGDDCLKPIYGTNIFASQAGQTAMGAIRGNIPIVVNREGMERGHVKATEKIVPMQAGTNKFDSQAGWNGIGKRRNQAFNVRMRLPNDRRTHGFVPFQAGSNIMASQSGMYDPPGCGAFRQATTYIDGMDLTDDQIRQSSKETPWFAGTNKFDTQTGTGGFFKKRDVLHRAKDKNPLPDIAVQKSNGIIPMQQGTNKLDSQRGMTGFGMPRDLLNHTKWKQDWLDEYEEAEREWLESGRGKLVDTQKEEKQAAMRDRIRSVGSHADLSEGDDDRSTMDQELTVSVSLKD